MQRVHHRSVRSSFERARAGVQHSAAEKLASDRVLSTVAMCQTA